MAEVLVGKNRQPKNRGSVGARLSALFHRNRPHSVQPVQEARAPQAKPEPKFVAAQGEKQERARDGLVDALNTTGLDFSKSFAVSFRPKEPYVKFPAAEKVIWTSYVNLVFDARSGQLQVDGQKHKTQANHMGGVGRKFWIDRERANSYSLALTLGEDGAVEDAKLPENYGRDAISRRYPGRNDLSSMDDLQESWTEGGYEAASSYVSSMSVFMAREADQVTVAYSDGEQPPAPLPIEIHTYAEEWGL